MSQSADESSGVLVSIALATYNGEAFIAEQIESLLNQDYSLHEIIICDDCSFDTTLEIIESFNSDIITVYRNDENLGYIKNFQKACELCQGEVIALCDQDDVWETDKISKLVKVLRNTESSAVFSDAALIDELGNDLGVSLWDTIFQRSSPKLLSFESLYMKNCVTGCTLLFERKLLLNALPFPPVMPHDWWLAYQGACSNGLYRHDEKLIRYRQHGGNTIGIKVQRDDNVFRLVKERITKLWSDDAKKRYQNWHANNKTRLKLMFEFESAHCGSASKELALLNYWINDKIAGKNLKKYSAFFVDSPDNQVFVFYRPVKHVTENMRSGLRRLKVRAIIKNLLPVIIICALLAITLYD